MSNGKSDMPETRRFRHVYSNKFHDTMGFVDMDQQRETDPKGNDMVVQGRTSIKEHEGKKYLREIVSADGSGKIQVDVYSVLEAFDVRCPALAHAVKKLLCAGKRSKGDTKADLIGVLAAVNRAIDLLETRGPDVRTFADVRHEGSGTDYRGPREE